MSDFAFPSKVKLSCCKSFYLCTSSIAISAHLHSRF